jgi:hypothetical protein
MNTRFRFRALARLTLALAPLGLAACANQAITQTGFLGQYDRLATKGGDEQALVYSSSSAGGHSDRRVVIEDVQLRLPRSQAEALPDKLVNQARADYRTALQAAFAQRYEVVDASTAEDALRVRAAITGLKPSSPTLNTVTFLLVGPVSNGGVSTESEVIDPRDGRRIAAQATYTNGHLFNGGLGGYFDPLGHVRVAFDAHAVKLRDLTLVDVDTATSR